MPKLYAEVIESEGLGDTVSLERESLGFTHCEVGGSIATAWKFPKSIVAAIKWHHRDNGVRPSAEAGIGYGRLCDVVSLADEMCLCLGIGFGRAESVNEELLTRVGISGTKFAELSTEFRDTFSEQKGVLLG
jgi:HD-like signal output (HDOD) protein